MTQKPSNLGLLAALLAYTLWGSLPLYWKLLKAASAVEILTHRIFWSLIFVGIIIQAKNGLASIRPILTNSNNLKRLLLTSLLIGANWLIYIWGVNNGKALECSLGYFICPLLTVALGYLFLKERLRQFQLIALGFALTGVLYKTWNYGALPLVAIALALTFAFYALLRKTAKVESSEGLFVETLFLAPVALIIIFLNYSNNSGIFLTPNYYFLSLLLASSGIVTAIPLLLFAYSTRRLSMSTIGVVQYLSPTLQFLCAVFIFNEPFNSSDLVAFSLIWIGLILYSLEGLYFSHKSQLIN